jgi:hypothetical protein
VGRPVRVQIPPSASSQYSKEIWLRAKFPFSYFYARATKCGSRSPRRPLPDYGCPENRPLEGSIPVPSESKEKSTIILANGQFT